MKLLSTQQIADLMIFSDQYEVGRIFISLVHLCYVYFDCRVVRLVD